MQKRSRSRSPKSYKKAKTSSSSSSRSPTPKPRKGYGSVARTRGAAVTGEMKYFDCELSTPDNLVAPTTAWSILNMHDPDSSINLGDAAVANPNCLFAPIPSASLNGRIGRKVAVHSICIKGIIRLIRTQNDTVAENPTSLRLLLVLDKQTNSTQASPALILNAGSSVNSTLFSALNPNGYGRFELLKDIFMTAQTSVAVNNAVTGTVSNAGEIKNFKLEHKFKPPLEVNFNVTNGGTVADIIDNSFHIVAGTQNVNLTPEISYYSRVCYTDA